MKLNGIEINLPDPYNYQHDYYQVMMPIKTVPVIDPNNVSEVGDFTPDILTFKKHKYWEANGAISIRWVLTKADSPQ